MAECECCEFEFRQRDLCEGRGLEGRPTPDLWRINEFRGRYGLQPLAKIVASETPVAPSIPRKPQPAKEQRQWTLAERVASVAKAAASVVFNGFHPLSEEQIAARLSICQTCEQFSGTTCKLCGCGCSGGKNLANKLAHPDQQCPHDPPKWGPVQ